jgi:hypothetical protein
VEEKDKRIRVRQRLRHDSPKKTSRKGRKGAKLAKGREGVSVSNRGVILSGTACIQQPLFFLCALGVFASFAWKFASKAAPQALARVLLPLLLFNHLKYAKI